MAPKNKSIKNFNLSTLSQATRNSPLYKRMGSDESRQFYYGTLRNLSPCPENSITDNLEIPGIKELYTYRNWSKWLKCGGGYDRASVMEFLATMKVFHDPRFHDADQEFGVEAMVNNKRVVITESLFNECFECVPPRKERGVQRVEYEEWIKENRDDLKKIVEEAYLMPGITLEHKDAYMLSTSKGKVLNAIIHNRIYSVTFPRKLYEERLALAYCIEQKDFVINLGRLICGNLMLLARNKGDISSLVYPRTITAFCAKAGVRITAETVDWAFKDKQLRLYKGYDHVKEGQQGDSEQGDGSGPARKKRTAEAGTSGFVPREDEPLEMIPFMEQYYIGRRELRDFMADTRARWAKEDAESENEDDGED